MFYDSGLILPVVHPNAEAVWHLFVVRVRERDRLQAKLLERDIAAGVHYPVLLHRQPAYKHLRIAPGTLPVTEMVAAEVLSLPMYLALTQDQIDAVGRVVAEATPLESLG
jgi:dTDP-4-amino-4,6-dideoxygalactose transaminase